jgi:diadenosine tetraphosphatase ApaH/serine/threonine PP2A family protein phosphatase
VRLGVFSDIHANWQALEAVLEHAHDIDAGICLGDVVGYGADPVRCLDEVRRLGWPTLVGNHDRACTDTQILTWFNTDAATVIHWTKDQLGEERLGWLGSLPEVEARNDVLLVHASPRDPIFEYVLDADTAFANLRLLGDRACFHGHTHVPGYFYFGDGESVAHNYWLGRVRVNGPTLINPGSVGQPRDGIPDASYGVWDLEAGMFEWRRVPYDRDGAKQAIRTAGLPDRFASRLDVGR